MTDNIHSAILKVYNLIGYVQKKGTINAGNVRYSFAGEADFIAALRPAMIEAGITVSPVHVSVDLNERIENEKVYNNNVTKTYQHRVCLLVTYQFNHAASDTSLEVMATGEGMDSGDKAFNKAMTGALKYALRQTFLIETGDDPDKYASDPDGGVQEAKLDAGGLVIHPSFKNAAERNKLMNALLAGIRDSKDVDGYVQTNLHDIRRVVNDQYETRMTINGAVEARKKALAEAANA